MFYGATKEVGIEPTIYTAFRALITCLKFGAEQSVVSGAQRRQKQDEEPLIPENKIEFT